MPRRRVQRPTVDREAPAVASEGDRLQKVLAQAGLASRRQAEQWIEAGRVTINGRIAELGDRVAGRDELRVDGRVVRRSKDPSRLPTTRSTFLLHRAVGQSLTTDMVVRLPRQGGRRFIAISPLPQGDGGLELVTTDGALAERCQRAVRHWEIEFLVRVRGALNELGREAIESGVLDDGQIVQVLAIENPSEPPEGLNRWYFLRTRGASGREVRQLFERQGLLVSRIQRTRLGPLSLTKDLSRGRFRMLGDEEGQAVRVQSEVSGIERVESLS
jgi:23S rRNA pseudouridine2605 synthase